MSNKPSNTTAQPFYKHVLRAENKYEQFLKLKPKNPNKKHCATQEDDTRVDHTNFFENLHKDFSSSSKIINTRYITSLKMKKAPSQGYFMPGRVSFEETSSRLPIKTEIQVEDIIEDLLGKTHEVSKIMNRSKSTQQVAATKDEFQKPKKNTLEAMLWNKFINSHNSLQENILPLPSQRKSTRTSTTSSPLLTVRQSVSKSHKRMNSQGNTEFLKKTYSQPISQNTMKQSTIYLPKETLSTASSQLKPSGSFFTRNKPRSQTPSVPQTRKSSRTSSPPKIILTRKEDLKAKPFIIRAERKSVDETPVRLSTQMLNVSQDKQLLEAYGEATNVKETLSSQEDTMKPLNLIETSEETEQGFSRFLNEYTPYHRFEADMTGLKGSIMEIFTFFGCLKTFTGLANYIPVWENLLAQLKHFYKSVALQTSHNSFEGACNELSKGKIEYTRLQAMISEAQEKVKSLETASPKFNKKSATCRDFTLSPKQRNELSDSGAIFDNDSSIEGHEIMKKADQISRKLDEIRELKRELFEKKDRFQGSVEDFLEDKMLKMQSNSFEGLVVNFFDSILSRFEDGLQENMKTVCVFFPSLQKYGQKLLYNTEVCNVKKSIRSLWMSLAEQIELSDLYKEELLGAMNLSHRIIKEILEVHSEILYLLEDLSNIDTLESRTLINDRVDFNAFQRLQGVIGECMGLSGGAILLTSATLNVPFLEKVNVRCGSFLRALFRLKTVSEMESEYEKNVNYCEKILLLSEERLRELEQKNWNHKIDLRTLEQAVDFAAEVNSCLIRVSICKDHFSEEQNIDLEIKADFIRRVIESLQGLVQAVTIAEGRLEKLIEAITAGLVTSYTKLVEEIRKTDGAFNVYITTNIIKTGSFLTFKNPGSHLIAVANFSKNLRKLEERLGYYQKSFGNNLSESFDKKSSPRKSDRRAHFGIDKADTTPRCRLGASTDRITNESFRRNRLIVLNPDLEIVNGVVENFKMKAKIFDQLFIFEDHFSMTNLEVTFSSVSSLTFPELLQSLYNLLSTSLEHQQAFSIQLKSSSTNDFLQNFIKDTMNFQTILQKFLKNCLDTVNKNLQTYNQNSKKPKQSTVEEYDKMSRQYCKLGKTLSENLFALAEKAGSFIDVHHPISSFFIELIKQLGQKELTVFEKIGSELQDACESLTECETTMQKRFGNARRLMDSIESEEDIKTVLYNIENNLEQSIKKLLNTISVEKNYLSDTIRSTIEDVSKILQERIEELEVIREVQGIQDVYTIKKFKEILKFGEPNYQTNWDQLGNLHRNLSEKLNILQSRNIWKDRKTTSDKKDIVHKCWELAIGLLENNRDFIHEVLDFNNKMSSTIKREYEKIQTTNGDLSRFFASVSEQHDLKLEDLVERIEKFQIKDEPNSIGILYKSFVKKILSLEGQVLRKLSQEAQEFEKMVQNLEYRFYKDGIIIKAEFLVYNFNAGSGFQIEELLFGAQKNANVIEELLQRRELNSNEIFLKELQARHTRLRQFERLLEASLAINKEVHLLQEKMREIFTRNLQVTRNVRELAQELEESAAYLERTETKILQSLKYLEERESLEKYVEAQMLRATREVHDYFVRIHQSIGELERDYSDRKKQTRQKALFLDDKFLKSLERGKELHRGLECKYVFSRKLSRSSSRDSNSRLSSKRLILLEPDKTGEKWHDDSIYERILDIGRTVQELEQYGINLEEEYCKVRYRILKNLHKALECLNTKYLSPEALETAWNPQGRKRSMLLRQIQSFIINVKAGKVDWDGFKGKVHEFLQTQKDIEWSLRFLKDGESLKKVEVLGVENLQVVSQLWAEDKVLKVWLHVLEIVSSHIIENYSEIKGEFKSGEEVRDFVETQVKSKEGVNEILKENGGVFEAMYNYYLKVSVAAE